MSISPIGAPGAHIPAAVPRPEAAEKPGVAEHDRDAEDTAAVRPPAPSTPGSVNVKA